jgi:hypothetical protein
MTEPGKEPPGDKARRQPVSDRVKPPVRWTIPACIGCGAMRQDQSCPDGCSERGVELVSSGTYDQMATAAAACRDRARGLWAVAGKVARAEPGHGEWAAAYQALQQSARLALRRYRPGPGDRDDLFPPAQIVVVWRCQVCGSVDAPQPCIGVCIWRRAEWVDASRYELERSRAIADYEAEQPLVGLLGRLAFATPRATQWERSLRALQAQARHTFQESEYGQRLD